MAAPRFTLPHLAPRYPSAAHHCARGERCRCRPPPFGLLLVHAPFAADPTRSVCGYTAGWVNGAEFWSGVTCEACRAALGLRPEPLPDGWVIVFRDRVIERDESQRSAEAG